MEKNFDKVVDSGKREKFNTGSVRDTAEGKGMPHLIAGEALAYVRSFTRNSSDNLLYELEDTLNNYSKISLDNKSNEPFLHTAIDLVIEHLIIQEGSYSGAMTRLAIHYENGAKKYDKNNWRKGQPVSRYYDSAMRHLLKEIDEMIDEDHAAAIFWNLLGIVQTKIDVSKGCLPKELDDFPFEAKEVWG